MTSGAELDELADKIVARLGNVVPATLPSWAGELVRDVARFGPYRVQHVFPLTGADCLIVQYTCNPDASLSIELAHPNGTVLWRGTLRPAAGAEAAADGNRH